MNPSPTPAAPPPPGVIPNFIHPLTFENTILGFAIFIILLTVFFVVIRLYSNYHAVRGLGWDDCGLSKLPRLENLRILTSSRVLRCCNTLAIGLHWNWPFS